MILPRFAGNYKNWEEFRDYYKSMFIDDPSFDNLQRLHYLKSCLDGEASQLLRNVQTTAANFPIAWKLLTERYANERRLVNLHLADLFALKSVSRENSPSELRKLLDTAKESIEALKLMKHPVQDDILVFLLTQRVDREAREAWELTFNENSDFPTFANFESFLTSRIRALEASSIIISKSKSSSSSAVQNPSTSKAQSHLSNATAVKCPVCGESHSLYRCKRFISKPVSNRWDVAKQIQVCLNCLCSGHQQKSCPSKRSCFQCNSRHHTLLHRGTNSNKALTETLPVSEASASTSSASEPRVDTNLVQSHLVATPQSAHVVLATAWIMVTASSKRTVKLRALLDPGSTHSFITRDVANALQARSYSANASVSGIGGGITSTVKRTVPITITPIKATVPAFSTDALVLDTLTTYLPRFRHPLSTWPHLDGLIMADECPASDIPIHAIIGADLHPYMLRDGIRRGRMGEPVAQNTVFGWVLSGRTKSQTMEDSTSPVHVHHTQIAEDLSGLMSRFWEIEEIPRSSPASEEDVRCEEHFRKTHSRTPGGQYVVRLPLKSPSPIDIGDTRARAQRCLLSLEKRLSSRPDERESYMQFLAEYEELGHMRLAPARERNSPCVYLPHHSIVKASSSTTKTRIVFNASAVSTNGRSLNELQMTGPKLQSDLSLVHTQWRAHRFVYSADIAKMYRQILIDTRDIDLQRILWRRSPAEAINEYQLRTVTYGTASAPFLALRVLKQLADDEGGSFPLGRRALLTSMYIDDALFGADSVPQIRLIRDQLVALLNRGHFELRKWASNAPELLCDIDPHNHGLAVGKTIEIDDSVKILGITWLPALDCYRFVVARQEIPVPTKRKVLSVISRLFDPLGFLSPVIILAKIFMQTLWISDIAWDTPLPENLAVSWRDYYDSLPKLNDVTIPRWIGTPSEPRRYELHGFSDASTKAYASVVYVRVESNSGMVTTTLLTSKSRIAPTRQLTVPRLELCGALLLARLISKLRSLSAFQGCNIHCWTDATIVLDWLNEQSSHWKTFVANRVAEIHSLLPDITWRHVPGSDNPADLASRGVKPADIGTSNIWWRGPPWLALDSEDWPTCPPAVVSDAHLEARVVSLQANVSPVAECHMFERFSSWPKLIRVVARILRWVHYVRKRCHHQSDTADRSDADALTDASTRVFSIVQKQQFPEELRILSGLKPDSDGIRRLTVNVTLPRHSALRRLNPILGRDGLIRVGGRLSLSALDPSSRHPIIIGSSHVAKILVREAHRRCLHGGISLTLSTLRNSVWLIQGRKSVKSLVYRCIACTRIRAELPNQLMGSLPAARVHRPSRAFVECGIDYAGPVAVRMASGRGARAQPGYIALFVCMATKAVHLEIVTSCSTPAFLAAFDRFCSRRGLPRTMHSDRGTNFQGADKEMRAAYQAAITDKEVRARVAEDRIEWKFIPPAAPHFGGLWEAGVKVMKHHLKRVLGKSTPTYEELATLLCRIEASMNSRPLAPLNDDIESLDVLTPAHFLIGGPLTALPMPPLLDTATNRLSRWQAIQQMLERFWRLWSQDYVKSCQHRSKWLVPTAPIQVGQIVLLRNPNLPPTKWDLGRIIHCHPGPDGLVRVVTVKTSSSELTRPITQLALLPVDLENQDASSTCN
ncbi:PREDICTED: uncharacterized protein LOC108751546 [Trachymyrmex septentrionalis]|uniref:uncharacterized protein LOC108751546 n=1 Tax=Trachymyrmex septentrionalis TaxID=34720 RepID=UPI00084F5FB1|nr:PREDICTED: uncharacterized protein LOC108751546 [Trachymyrmex septentrionalis]